uniref:Rhodanese domain-containing protein n=1 Tax=Ananas comosus var. bracteatus TaxID=296719 RepID=A0A6V7PDF9_ANACO|nr:unnamed protein product [Ananas comosus var. bracteatus]
MVLLSPPFFGFSKSSCFCCRKTTAAAAAAAALRMLSRSSANPNPNPRLLSAMGAAATGTGSDRTLAPHLPHIPNPSPSPLKPLHLHVAGPRSVLAVRGDPLRSSAIAVANASGFTSAPPPPPRTRLRLLLSCRSTASPISPTRRDAAAAEGSLRGSALTGLADRFQRVSGGIILAPEGINGSICGTPESVEKVLAFIQSDERLKGLRMIESPVTPEDEAIHHGHTSQSPLGAGEDAPFRWDHVRVKLKKEIVSFGDPSVMPTKMVGKYIKPRDWNALISDPKTMVIDVRNTYETRIGKFKGAVDPCTTAFREFPSWVDDQFELAKPDNNQSGTNSHSVDKGTEDCSQSGEAKRLPRVAMYCTGGIRCEKASSFLVSKGFEEVYHLEGGILKYLEEVPKAEAYGRASALSLISASRSSTDWSKEATSSAMVVSNRSATRTWNLRNGNTVYHARIAIRRNLLKKKKGRGLDNGSLRLGEL